MTAETCGIRSADIRAWLKKMRPKWSRSGNTSACSGRNAPPESTRYTQGRRFCSAMSFDVLRAAALAGGEQTLLQLGDEPQHAVTVALKGRVAGIDVRVEDYHPQQSVSSPRAGQRQRACIRYISKAGDTGSDMSKI